MDKKSERDGALNDRLNGNFSIFLTKNAESFMMQQYVEK